MKDKKEIVISVKDVYKGFKIYYDRGHTLKEKLIYHNSKYSYREVLKGISFDVEKGEAVALIGRNGCGKSTTLKLLTKIIYPNSGSVEMKGRVVSLIELGAGFHPDMSGRENIYINASIFGLSKKEIDRRLEDIISFSELEEFIDNPVRTYSSGMYMRLAFAVAINVDADILLIDEILAVGDAAFQAKCFNRMREIKGSGTTIVLVSHSMGQVEQLCDRSIWIEDGKIRAEGKPSEVDPKYLDFMAQKTINQDKAAKEAEKSKEEEDTEESGPYKDTDKRYGRKDVVMTNIRLLDENGDETSTVMTEKEFSVEVDYKVYKPIKDAVIGIGIFRNDGVACYGTNTQIERFDKFDITEDGGFKITFPKTMLLQGGYWLDFAIEVQGGIPIDYYKEAIRFNVVSSVGDAYIMRIPHKWESDIIKNGVNML